MAISPMDLEGALDGVNELALPVLIAFGLYPMVCRLAGRGVSARRPAIAAPPAVSPSGRRPSRAVRRATSVLGLVLSVGSPATAGERPLPRHRIQRSVQISNLRPEPGRFPPPRRPGPAEPPTRPGFEPPWLDDRGDGRTAAVSPGAHPAVHARGDATLERLFPRWEPGVEAGSQLRRSNGREERRAAWHAVLPGETLWSIAAERLGTDDVRRVARYWPRIHRANRDVIGSDPSLIRPGQVLELPPERS